MAYKNHFCDLEAFKRAVPSIGKEEIADWIKIGKDWFVCEEYDGSGKYMRYASITAQLCLDINTNNRYSETWLKDATIDSYTAEDYRFAPDYYICMDDYRKLSKDDTKKLLTHIAETYSPQNLVDFIITYSVKEGDLHE